MVRLKKTPEGLIEKIREGLKGDERTVESAVQALGAVKDKGSTNALVSILEKSKSVRIKQTILMTLAKIDAENAFEIISSKMEEDSVLTFDGAKAILKLGDPRGVELLKKYGKSYPNQIVRANIRKFAAKLQTKLSKKKTKKN